MGCASARCDRHLVRAAPHVCGLTRPALTLHFSASANFAISSAPVASPPVLQHTKSGAPAQRRSPVDQPNGSGWRQVRPACCLTGTGPLASSACTVLLAERRAVVVAR
jgi:hypothetical protein